MTSREPDPFAVPAERAERDDPFARAPAGGEPSGATPVERSVSMVGPLAERDPHAPPERSAEYHLDAETSFDDLLRHARRRGFLAGLAVGGLAALAVAAAIRATSPPAPPGTPPPPPPRAAAGPDPAAGAAGARTAPERAPAARDEQGSRTARRRDPSPSQPGPRPPAALPGLDLRAPPPPAPEPARPPDGAAGPPGPAQRTLEDADVGAALAGRRGDIEACSRAHAGDAAGAGGRRFHLVVTFAASGRVLAARIDDAETGATGLGACLVEAARAMTVPPFDGDPVRVELPLRLAGGE